MLPDGYLGENERRETAPGGLWCTLAEDAGAEAHGGVEDGQAVAAVAFVAELAIDLDKLAGVGAGGRSASFVSSYPARRLYTACRSKPVNSCCVFFPRRGSRNMLSAPSPHNNATEFPL